MANKVDGEECLVIKKDNKNPAEGNALKKSLRSDSGIGLENVDNQENLDKYLECEKKMDDEILCNLLKNVQKSLPSSGVASDDDDSYSTNSKVDYKSLVEALSSCSINSKSKKENDSKVNKKKTEQKQAKEKSNNGGEISDIKDLFATKIKTDDKKSKKSENKNDKSKEQDKNGKIGKDTDKLSSAAIMEQLSAKISRINLAKQQKSSKIKSSDVEKTKEKSSKEKVKEASSEKTAVKKYETSAVNCNDKNHVQIVPRDTQNKKDKKYSILLERGPWSKSKTYGARNASPYIQTNQQVNTNILSGGVFWTANEPAEPTQQTIPDFESIMTKPLSGISKPSNDYTAANTQSIIQNNVLEDILSHRTIAEVIDKEVMSLVPPLASSSETSEQPNWSDIELIELIMQKEAGNIDLPSNDSIIPPTIIVNEHTDTLVKTYQTGNPIVNNEVNDSSFLAHQFIVSSPTSDRLHEVSYGCQRIDQLTPTSQTSSFSFDNQITTNDLCQTFEQSPTPTSMKSPMQVYSPADSSLSLKIPHNSSSIYSPAPSTHSINTGSPEQFSFMDSPNNIRTSNNDINSDINNLYMNQPYYYSSFKDTFSTQISSPNDSLQQGSASNRSSFCGSDYLSEQCFTSPSADRIENQHYDNMYELSSPSQQPRTSKESFSSTSPLESPDIYFDPDELESFTNALSNIGQVNIVPEYNANQKNFNDVCLQLHSIQNQSDLKMMPEIKQETIILKQTLINNTQHNQTINYSQQSTLSNQSYTPRTESKEQKISKNSKIKPIPIAAKQSFPCCVKLKKNAREILEEMFQRLDENMQSNVLLKVHTLNDENLMKLLDTLLAGWSCAKLPIPRLPLLYVICERLLMTKTTMMKFFKTYGNGHTILDRALLTCSQSPILSRYIAECSIKAMDNLQKDRNFEIDKTDSHGNSILHRAIYAGVECAVPVAYLLQLNTNGSVLNVDRLNAEGYTPLHLACSIHVQQTGGLVCSCLIMSHILLEHGKSNPNIKDRKSGMTALHTAINSNGCSPALVSLLLKYGADPSMKNYYSSTVLDLAKSACRSSNNLQSARQVVDILKKLKK